MLLREKVSLKTARKTFTVRFNVLKVTRLWPCTGSKKWDAHYREGINNLIICENELWDLFYANLRHTLDFDSQYKAEDQEFRATLMEKSHKCNFTMFTWFIYFYMWFHSTHDSFSYCFHVFSYFDIFVFLT